MWSFTYTFLLYLLPLVYVCIYALHVYVCVLVWYLVLTEVDVWLILDCFSFVFIKAGLGSSNQTQVLWAAQHGCWEPKRVIYHNIKAFAGSCVYFVLFWVFCLHVSSSSTMPAWCLRESEESIECPATGVKDSSAPSTIWVLGPECRPCARKSSEWFQLLSHLV